MPAKDYNNYMNTYMKDRWEKRRASAIEHLGGKCVECGTTECLEFDHVDRTTKEMSIAKASSRSEDFFWTEVAKCQLLCTDHHLEKSREFGDTGTAKHGTLSLRGCKCVPCKEARNKYNRERKQRLRSTTVSARNF